MEKKYVANIIYFWHSVNVIIVILGEVAQLALLTTSTKLSTGTIFGFQTSDVLQSSSLFMLVFSAERVAHTL